MRQTIANALTNNPYLDISPGVVEGLTRHLLEALAHTPNTTPAPHVVDLPAQLAVTISAEELVAMLAERNLHERPGLEEPVECHTGLLTQWSQDILADSRDLLLDLAPMFGCRARSTYNHGVRVNLVAGRLTNRNALIATVERLLEAGRPAAMSLPAQERREFWTALSAFVINTREAALIFANMAPHTSAASALLVQELGPARSLRRATTNEGSAAWDLARDQAQHTPIGPLNDQ